MTLQWVAAEMRTGAVIDELPSFDPNDALRTSLANYDTGSGVLHLDGAPTNWRRCVKPGASWLACYDDDDPSHPIQWVGYVTSRVRNLSSSDVSLSLVTAGGYLDRVYVGDRDYPAATWARNQIATDLISSLAVEQPGRKGIPLELAVIGGNGPNPLADYVWQNTDNVTLLGRLQTLFGELGGEWFIDWQWSDDGESLVPVMTYGDRIGDQPVPGLASKATFEFPGPVIDINETLDYTDGKGATSITAYSTPSSSDTVTPVADPVLVDDDDRPLFEYRYQPAPLLTVARCASFAQLAAQILGPGSLAYEVTVSRSRDANGADPLNTRRYGVDYGMGDDIDLVVDQVDSDGRPILAFPDGLDITGRLIAHEITSDSIVTPVLALPTFLTTDDELQVIPA